MFMVPSMAEFQVTRAQPIVEVNSGDETSGFATALGVEIPLMVLALSTVVLRVYSRLAIKRKLATDDVLIILGTVSISSCTSSRSIVAKSSRRLHLPAQSFHA
jgi:hypothetical protein